MNPYQTLPASAFWRSAVADKNMFDIGGLWVPRFNITPESRIATFGSCFSQQFGRALLARHFNWVQAEPAPHHASAQTRARFSYDQFSARTGNIYTTSLLHQWVRWGLGDMPPPGEVWQQNGRFIDPFRPVVEPDGFASLDELQASRTKTIAAVGHALRTADIVFFTLGLTESWHRAEGDLEYPMCPGTAAGEFDAERYRFHDQSYDDIWRALRRAIGLMRKARPGLKILLSVSPVPITASNSGKHAMLATSATKSTLRAVAETALRTFKCVDYFPSYELITQPAFRGVFYEPNMRNVNATGIQFVMRQFFEAIGHAQIANQPQTLALDEPPANEVACEDEILAAFGKFE